MIEEASPELKEFFLLIVNTIISRNRSAHNKLKAKKLIVVLCYIIAGLHNKFVNQFKLEIRLYLAALGTTWEAIDIMSSFGFLACGKTIADFQKKIQTIHLKLKITFQKSIFIYNPNNIEAPRICWYLLNNYTGIFDVLYTNFQEHQGINTFDRIELLTVYIYDNAIAK
ncbi:unnamed protein product [Rhizophagus irregularis]|nr:unnamed protein product [Rhizophagus irregularis]